MMWRYPAGRWTRRQPLPGTSWTVSKGPLPEEGSRGLQLDELPDETRASIGAALDRTATGSRLQLNIAWNYAGRTELVDAFRRIAASGATPDGVDERTISDALYTSGLPDPDLLVRTGGEQRISNFLIWQSAYAELVFTDCLWPDFGEDAFDAALLEFARRNRRFGR
jgi:undecaprenyl diphosphate synthase